jgi:CubicO group peptidase (beta-lactamase class C family)
MTHTIPPWVTYPTEDWKFINPQDAGLDVEKYNRLLDALDVRGAAFGGENHSGDLYGAVLSRGGYLLHAWGDRHYRFQTASVGKALMWVLVGLAVEEGRLDPDQPIHQTWSGAGLLSHPHKHLDAGHHATLTVRHILGPKEESKHYGGFPMEIGYEWQKGRAAFSVEEADKWVPAWANWSGDPFYDLYSHAEPGTVGHYSSAGFWRLSQVMTHIWDRDLKEVLDEKLFSRIGLPAERWDWYSGRVVSAKKYFYPGIPDSYTYLDPPYEVNGHPVRSGPGWVVISASDLARFGHLLATGGEWEGEQLIDPQWLRGHSGGNRSGASGESTYYTAMGVVTTEGLDHVHALATNSFLPEDLFIGPVEVE